MILIDSNDNATFKLNGKAYPRVFVPIILGENTIAIYNVFDVKQQLLASTTYNTIAVNGTTYGNINTLVEAITLLTYNVGGSEGLIDISAGANIAIDKSNPQNPVISSSGGGGEGTVTDLGYNPSSTNGVITNSHGDNATIPLANGTYAGLLSPSQRNIITNLSSNYLGINAKASDSNLLDGLNSTDFLRSNGKASDSNLLDGLDSSTFMRAQNTNGYYGLVNPANSNSAWIRTTQSGLLPYASGGNSSSLGTSSWNFKTIYGGTIYENNTSLSSKYLGITAKAVDSDKLDGLNSTDFLRSNAKASDSNLLDGLDSSAFVRSNANDTKSGYLIMNDNSHLRLGSGSDFRMYFNGTNTYFDMYAGNLYFRQNSTTRITFERSNGNITTTGTMYATNFFETSDERFKTNIQPLSKGLKSILNVDTYTYNWKHNDNGDIGVIAQEIEKEIPEIVNTNEEGFKSVSYTKLTPILINAIKDLNKIVDEQNEKIKDLTERINIIENRI
ncbi:tail fiber domain-containing protein [Galbibacter pacificus]|uniref:Tail fiber domain-containing protein n=1 Tax=Galbibacter pacificus TaxID=2996052 RepID=A0ABT6FRT1_9FLAO|nr:tail fiber domain-containing protein [Galbibacter pacificus]MDG3581767.1 tail fiber domain-containing protein [Galbibacter pacificus]MDG3585759.1 tail fiber domain-containing protein [Galbibacter pacificus]